MKQKDMDAFLGERLGKYDHWLREEKISFSSKVVPVRESLEATQWVLPTEQVLKILENVRSIALTNCVCRSHYRRCDGPVDVCLLINDYGDRFVQKGLARHIAYEEAVDVLRSANAEGLVHLSLYRPDHELYALCSCCPCCCHDLQLLKACGRTDLVVHSEYIAVTDMESCIHCGECIDRCFFGARIREGGQMIYNADACYGCGLCVTICPEEATILQQRIKMPSSSRKQSLVTLHT